MIELKINLDCKNKEDELKEIATAIAFNILSGVKSNKSFDENLNKSIDRLEEVLGNKLNRIALIELVFNILSTDYGISTFEEANKSFLKVASIIYTTLYKLKEAGE